LFELQLLDLLKSWLSDFLASGCWLFAIDFCNKFLASQHTKSHKHSQRAFQLLVYFLRSQLSSFSKSSSAARLIVSASGFWPAKS